MKTITCNRWLKLIAWLLVIVIIVMLLIPAELADEQLAQIKPGISIAEVIHLLGEPKKYHEFNSSSMGKYWSLKRKWWKPNLEAKIEDEAIATLTSGCYMAY